MACKGHYKRFGRNFILYFDSISNNLYVLEAGTFSNPSNDIMTKLENFMNDGFNPTMGL